MTTDDVPSVVEHANAVLVEDHWITRQAGQEFVEDDFLKLFNVADSAQFVATIDDEIVGIVRLRKEADGRIFLGMSVSKDFRRRGVGRALLREAIVWAGKRANEVYLSVYSHNAPAIALYRRNHFKEIDYRSNHCVRRSGEVWDLITMVRNLGSSVEQPSA